MNEYSYIFVFTDHLFQVAPHATRAAKAAAQAAYPILVRTTPNVICLSSAARLAGQARIGSWTWHIADDPLRIIVFDVVTTGFFFVMRTRHRLSIGTSSSPRSVNIVSEWHCDFNQVIIN